MTNMQLLLVIFIPTFTVIAGFATQNARLSAIEQRLISIESDLRQFYKDLGRHEADIDTLKHRS